ASGRRLGGCCESASWRSAWRLVSFSGGSSGTSGLPRSLQARTSEQKGPCRRSRGVRPPDLGGFPSALRGHVELGVRPLRLRDRGKEAGAGGRLLAREPNPKVGAAERHGRAAVVLGGPRGLEPGDVETLARAGPWKDLQDPT